PRPRSAEPPRRVERQTARHHSAVRRPQPKTPNAKASPSPASEKVAQAAEANSLGAAAKPATAAGGEAALLPAEERSLLFAWGAAIRAAIERERRYPRSARRAGLEGTTVIALTVTQNGRLIAVRTLVGSGSRTLDAAAKAAAESVSRYPAADPRLGKERYTFELPLAFQLSR
ncbi:MAG TPA: TonB family protein, partial [Alphaproteobacteria bacterium]|nr:TonB family protein [Alphaproteobacteria bacterium]